MRANNRTNESPLNNLARGQSYEDLKTRLRWRIQRARRVLSEREGVELPTVPLGK